MHEGLDNYSNKTRTKKPFGMKHPVCGGNLFAHTRVVITDYFSKNI